MPAKKGKARSKYVLRIVGIVLGVLSVNLPYCEDHPGRCKGVVSVVDQILEVQDASNF